MSEKNDKDTRANLRGRTSDAVPPSVVYIDDITVRHVFSGAEHTACVSASGEMYTWGAPLGQLGWKVEEEDNAHYPHLVEGFSIDNRVTRVSCASTHSAAVTNLGCIYVWGRGINGQLGLGTDVVYQEKPALVNLEEGGKAMCVSCGMAHTVVATELGDVYTWGWGRGGQLGHGTRTSEWLPREVEALRGKKIVSVAAGVSSTLVLTDNGEVYFFGSDMMTEKTDAAVVLPQLVGGLSKKKITAIAAGGHHSMALSQTGDICTWGSGLRGQLGHGARGCKQFPHVVKWLKGKSVSHISAGLAHSALLTDEGEVYVWGAGMDGGVKDVLVPKLVPELQGKGLVSISCGWTHNVAISYEGTMWAWGVESEPGMLGTRSRFPRKKDIVSPKAKKTPAKKRFGGAAAPFLPKAPTSPLAMSPSPRRKGALVRSRSSMNTPRIRKSVGNSTPRTPKSPSRSMQEGTFTPRLSTPRSATRPQTSSSFVDGVVGPPSGDVAEFDTRLRKMNAKIKSTLGSTRRQGSIVRKLRDEVGLLREIVDSDQDQHEKEKREQTRYVKTLLVQIAELKAQIERLSFVAGQPNVNSPQREVESTNIPVMDTRPPPLQPVTTKEKRETLKQNGMENPMEKVPEPWVRSPHKDDEIDPSLILNDPLEDVSDPLPPPKEKVKVPYIAEVEESTTKEKVTQRPWSEVMQDLNARDEVTWEEEEKKDEKEVEADNLIAEERQDVAEDSQSAPVESKENKLQGESSSKPHDKTESQRRWAKVRATARAVYQLRKAGALHKAVRKRSPSLVSKLLERGMDPNVEDEEGYTPLSLATQAGDVSLARMLVEKGRADVDHADDRKRTPLHHSAVRDDMDMSNILLGAGASLNAKDLSGASPLQYACVAGNFDSAKLLLDMNAPVDDKDDMGRTALHLAVHAKQSGISLLLIDHGASVSSRDSALCTPLHYATARGASDIAEMLLERGASVDARDAEGCPPLHFATVYNFLHVLQVLLNAASDVRAADSQGRTALHHAAREGSVDCVRELMSHGAEINRRDADGFTPIHLAYQNRHDEICDMLLEYGADQSDLSSIERIPAPVDAEMPAQAPVEESKASTNRNSETSERRKGDGQKSCIVQ